MAYFAISNWLQNFALRTKIGWEVFLLSGSLVLFLSLLTVCYQTIKAALSNPVDSLRLNDPQSRHALRSGRHTDGIDPSIDEKKSDLHRLME